MGSDRQGTGLLGMRGAKAGLGGNHEAPLTALLLPVLGCILLSWWTYRDTKNSLPSTRDDFDQIQSFLGECITEIKTKEV